MVKKSYNNNNNNKKNKTLRGGTCLSYWAQNTNTATNAKAKAKVNTDNITANNIPVDSDIITAKTFLINVKTYSKIAIGTTMLITNKSDINIQNAKYNAEHCLQYATNLYDMVVSIKSLKQNAHTNIVENILTLLVVLSNVMKCSIDMVTSISEKDSFKNIHIDYAIRAMQALNIHNNILLNTLSECLKIENNEQIKKICNDAHICITKNQLFKTYVVT